jgi:hypothetical protein
MPQARVAEMAAAVVVQVVVQLRKFEETELLSLIESS